MHRQADSYTNKIANFISNTSKIMMIALITLNSSLVPLIEGLSSSNPVGFEFSVLRSLLLLFFLGRKNILKERSSLSYSKIASRLLTYIYTCVLCTHIRIHICRDSVHLWFWGPPSVSSRPLGSHLSIHHAVCVCACVFNHIHSHHVMAWHSDRKKPPPPGGFPIYYVPSSRNVCKRNPLKEPGTNPSRGVLLHTVLDEGT